MGPLPSAKHKWHIDNALGAMITAGVVHNGESGFIAIFIGSRTLRLAKAIGVLPILAVYLQGGDRRRIVNNMR